MPVTPTEVNVDLRQPSGEGVDVPAKGYLECMPSLRRDVDTYTVLPESFNAILVDGKVTLFLAPTDGTVWYWKITERNNRGKSRNVKVPTSGPVNYGDLEDVFPLPPGDIAGASVVALNAEVAAREQAIAAETTERADADDAISVRIDDLALGAADDAAVATRLGAGPLSKAALAGEVDDATAPLSVAVAAKIATSVNQVDIRSFLTSGQPFPIDGTGDHGPLMQAAVDACTGFYALTGVPQQINYPNGVFRATTGVNWSSGVGLKGQGPGTVFKPTGRTCLITGLQVGSSWYEDLHFADFIIDGVDQTHTAADSHLKGIFIQNMRRFSFSGVTIKNIWATGFGPDFLDDGYFIDSHADNCGVGVHATSPWGTGAGFGFSVGLQEIGRVALINCTSTNNASWGFFTQKTSGSLWRSRGFKMTACSASGNWGGFADEGCDGAIITGNDLSDNRFAGVVLVGQDAPAIVNDAGQNGLIQGNILKRNGANTANEGGVGKGGAVVAYNTMGAPYRVIGNIVEDNYGPGVWVPPTSIIGPDFEVASNRFFRNAGPAVKIESTLQLMRPRIVDNVGSYNGGIGGDGIYISAPTVRPEIHGNDMGRQARGVVLDGAGVTAVEPRIYHNDLADCVKSVVTVQTVTDSTNIRDNIVASAATIKNYCTNPNLGTDSTGYISTGGFTSTRTADTTLAAEGVPVAWIRSGAAPSTTTVVHRGPTVAVTAGEVWTLTAWARCTADRSLTSSVTDGTSNTALASNARVRATGDWQRITVTVVVPTGTTSIRLTVGRSFGSGTGPSAAGDVLAIGAVAYFKSANTYDYFDGASPGCAWDGTANLSTSTKTV